MSTRRVSIALLGLGLVALSARLESSADAPPASGVEVPPPFKAPIAPSAVRTALPSESTAQSARYFADTVMVRAGAEWTLEDVAREFGTEVVRPAGRSGFGAISVPSGTTAAVFLQQLRGSGIVRDLAPLGRVHGATTDYVSLQRHLVDHNVDVGAMPDLTGFVVAVLDTGVAYENHSDASGTFVAAPSLASSEIVAPYDFVNDDAHANDDHQHGTHIASLIASDGAYRGAAPGVGLMPVKVLDADNSGDELSLIEGIWHAIDNGADVINMSLCMAPGYAPSGALLEALEAAQKAGIVMVGASGNDAWRGTAWPAAGAGVIAVAAGRRILDGSRMEISPADYANYSSEVDLFVEGGDLDRDVDGNGVPDGLLAESIDPNDPSSVGPWLMAGTSQAAAVGSAAAVWALAGGVAPGEVLPALQNAVDNYHFDDAMDGNLRPGDDIDFLSFKDLLDDYDDMPPPMDDVYVSVAAYHLDRGSVIRPEALLSAFDVNGDPIERIKLFAWFQGDGADDRECWTGSDGTCRVHGETAPKRDANGDLRPLVTTVTVVAARRGSRWVRPRMGLLGSEEVEAVVGATELGALQGAPLGVHIEAGDYGRIGDVLEGYSVSNHGTGIATSPFGLVFNRRVVEMFGSSSSTFVAFPDGVEWEGDEVAGVDLELVDLSGTGIATSPFGFLPRLPKLTLGTGIATSPFGRIPVLKDSPRSTTLGSSATARQIDRGGWSHDGTPGAHAALGAGLDATGVALDGATGSGAGAEPLD